MLLVPRKTSGAASRKAIRRAGRRRGGEQAEQDSPGEQRGEGGGDGGIKIVMEDGASEELDDGGLHEEGERRVGEREVAVGQLAERDAGGVFEDVAEVPEHGEVGSSARGRRRRWRRRERLR